MSYYGILKQAEFADKIGNYRLADNLISKLIRLAKPGPKEIGLLFGIDDLLRRIKPPKGAKTLPQKLDDLVKQSVLRVVLEVRKVTPGPELEKSFDEIGVPLGYRKSLANMLKSGDPEKIAKAEAYLSKKISNKYEADIKAAETVPPPSDPKPSDPPKPEPGKIDPPKTDESTVKSRLEEISKTFKGTKEQLLAELKRLEFTDDEIKAAGIIEADGKVNIINVNKLINNASPERVVELELSNSRINFGGRATSLAGMTYAQLADLLRRTDILPDDQTKIINKIKIQLRKDPNLVVDEDLRRYFSAEFHSPRPPKPDAPTTPGSTAPGSTADEAVEAVSNPNKIPWKAWAAGIGTGLLLAYGWTVINGTIVHKDTGKPVTDEEGNAAMNSAGAGAGSQFKSKSDMYEQRMRTTPNQQMMKGNKPQEFVDANKGKFKTQREFYDAAFAAVDKNFANSVVALVKKDLDLPVSAEDQRKF